MLLTKEDPAFRKALADTRIMSIPGGGRGSKSDYGLVGYDEEQRGQLLVFPKSLKKFEAMKIVGIKYDLLSGQEEAKEKPEPSKKSVAAKENATSKKSGHSAPVPKTSKPAPAKVIEGPKPPPVRVHNADDDLRKVLVTVQAALKALEKGKAVAAYNLLKKAKDSIE